MSRCRTATEWLASFVLAAMVVHGIHVVLEISSLLNLKEYLVIKF